MESDEIFERLEAAVMGYDVQTVSNALLSIHSIMIIEHFKKLNLSVVEAKTYYKAVTMQALLQFEEFWTYEDE